METSDIFKKVRKIEIKTRGLSNQIFAGEYHSVFKGKGMSFSEVREYQVGDDIRNIDWNVTARFNHPYIKVFEEERELTVMLLIDVSNSNAFGTSGQTKRDMITEIAAVLSFSAIKNNDKVGVIFFSDKIEKFIPPKKGTNHILRIIRELIGFRAESLKTDVGGALKFMTNAIKKRATVFVLSDFMSPNFEDELKIIGRKHDVISLFIDDKRETDMPDIGLAHFVDAETGKSMLIDTSSKAIRDNYRLWFLKREKMLCNLFTKSGVDYVRIETGEDYVKPLIGLFKRR